MGARPPSLETAKNFVYMSRYKKKKLHQIFFFFSRKPVYRFATSCKTKTTDVRPYSTPSNQRSLRSSAAVDRCVGSRRKHRLIKLTTAVASSSETVLRSLRRVSICQINKVGSFSSRPEGNGKRRSTKIQQDNERLQVEVKYLAAPGETCSWAARKSSPVSNII